MPGTQWPGQLGNFAIAGHRVTAGNPFWSLPSLQDGDLVYIETRLNDYTYRVTGRRVGRADRHRRARPGAQPPAAAAHPAADHADHLRPGLDRHPPGDRHRSPGRRQAPLNTGPLNDTSGTSGARMYAWLCAGCPAAPPPGRGC